MHCSLKSHAGLVLACIHVCNVYLHYACTNESSNNIIITLMLNVQLTLCIFHSARYFFHQLACLTSAPMPFLMVSCTVPASSSTDGWELTSVKKLNTTGSSWPATLTGSVTIHEPLFQRINFLHLDENINQLQQPIQNQWDSNPFQCFSTYMQNAEPLRRLALRIMMCFWPMGTQHMHVHVILITYTKGYG